MPHRFSATHSNTQRAALRRALAGLLVAAVVLQLGGCESVSAPVAAIQPQALETEQHVADAKYGIRVEGLRVIAGGSLLDFRYQVLDPRKAGPLLRREIKPTLLDDARSARLDAPDVLTPEQTGEASRDDTIHTGRTYFILFANLGKAVLSGDKLSLLLGQAKVAELIAK